VRKRERETTNFLHVAGQSSQTRVRQEVKNFEYLGTYLLADLVIQQSSLSIFFTEMAGRCNETQRAAARNLTRRTPLRERERERAIGLESDRQCFFLWRNFRPQKNPVPKGGTEEVLFGKKKKKNRQSRRIFRRKKV